MRRVWLSNTNTVSESPNRCGKAPPAVAAFVSRSFTPGMLLRVVSTSHAGFADFAALTKLCVFVATALQWSSRFKQTFHALCSAPAGPTATSKMVPAATCSPEGTSDSTSAPKCCNTRAASSVAHTVASSRVKNSMRAGLSLMPSICVVKSIYGTSSAISWSMRASEITTSIATSRL